MNLGLCAKLVSGDAIVLTNNIDAINTDKINFLPISSDFNSRNLDLTFTTCNVKKIQSIDRVGFRSENLLSKI